MNALLESKQLSKSFVIGKGNARPILKDVDLQMKRANLWP